MVLVFALCLISIALHSAALKPSSFTYRSTGGQWCVWFHFTNAIAIISLLFNYRAQNSRWVLFFISSKLTLTASPKKKKKKFKHTENNFHAKNDQLQDEHAIISIRLLFTTVDYLLQWPFHDQWIVRLKLVTTITPNRHNTITTTSK